MILRTFLFVNLIILSFFVTLYLLLGDALHDDRYKPEFINK